SSPETFQGMVELLCPEEAEALAEVTAALGRVPSPYRPRAAAVREAVLLALLATGPGRVNLEQVLEWILHQLFESPLPAPVARSLDRELSAAPARLPPAKRQALRRAVGAAAGPPAGGGAAEEVARPEPGVRRDDSGMPGAGGGGKSSLASKGQARRAPRLAEGEEGILEEGEGLYVANAGLVLISPFLPRLFERLGLLGEDESEERRLDGFDGASRAVHLLQYLVDGRTEAPEADLDLNKILAGWPLEEPVERAIEVSVIETEVAASLLGAVIAGWPNLGGTTVEGLQETFLRREGRLQRKEGGWCLEVQRKTVDVLMETIPWSFSVVLHPWMERPLHVSW
ncbi:MAG: hypothetical protein KDD47_27570, partial [Acidobacteria bacterium]|nr:hypothetical protein [Acidobacteriota bacterium]